MVVLESATVGNLKSKTRQIARFPKTSIEWAVWIAFLGQAWTSIFGTQTIVFIGSYNFSVAELSLVAGIFAFVDGALKHGLRISFLVLLVLLFALLTFLNAGRGLVENPSQALVAARSSLPFAGLLILSAVKFPPATFQRYAETVVRLVALGLCGIVFVRLFLGPQFLLVGGDLLRASEVNDGGRPLPAPGAFIIASAVVLQFSAWLRGADATRSAGIGAVLAVALVLTGQGTATIAALLGLIIVFTFEHGHSRAARLPVGLALMATAVLIALGLRGFQPKDWNGILPESVVDNFYRRQLNLGTREIVWHGAIESFQKGSMFNQIFGWPTGSAPGITILSRAWGHVEWKWSVHSMYIGTLLGQGIAGLVAYCLTLVASLSRGALNISRETTARSLALTAMLATFSYSYSLTFEQAVLLVLSASYLTFPKEHKGLRIASQRTTRYSEA